MTLYADISGMRATKLELTIPYYGTWAADVELPTEAAIPAQCTLTLADLAMAGHVYRTDSFGGLRRARIVGGFGGWSKVVSGRHYHNGPTVSVVLRDAASEVGERVFIALDSIIGGDFVREASVASRLLFLAGALWWIDSLGVTQIGTARDALPISTPFLIQEFDPGTGRLVASTENPADWMPGRTVSNSTLSTPRTLSLVRHTVDNGGKLRTEALTA